MHIVIAGGTGFIGQALIRDLLTRDNKISVIGRSVDKIKHIFSSAVQALEWQQLQPGTKSWNFVQEADIIINLTGASIGEKRWSQARKQEILDSRVQPTSLLANLCAERGANAPRLLNASAIGIYGAQITPESDLPLPLDENEPISAPTYRDFLSQVAHLWENAVINAINSGVSVTLMRFAVVLGQKGGILAQLKLPFKLGLGGKIGNGRQAFSWIAIDDLIRAINFIVENKALQGPINIVSPGIVTQAQFAEALAKVLHRPCFLSLPKWLIDLVFGQMGKELLLQGQYVVPSVLLANNFNFNYPELNTALLHIFNQNHLE